MVIPVKQPTSNYTGISEDHQDLVKWEHLQQLTVSSVSRDVALDKEMHILSSLELQLSGGGAAQCDGSGVWWSVAEPDPCGTLCVAWLTWIMPWTGALLYCSDVSLSHILFEEVVFWL